MSRFPKRAVGDITKKSTPNRSLRKIGEDSAHNSRSKEAVSNYFEAVFFIRNLYQNSVLVLRDEYKTERTYVREYLCDSGSDKNVFETISI